MNIQPDPAWRRAGLLLVAHGARAHPPAQADTEGHASRLRGLGWFGEVETAFFVGGRSIADSLPAMAAETIYVVPHFMGKGYFVRQALPDAFDKANDPRTIRLCDPPSTHPEFPALVADLVAGTCANAGFEREACNVVLAAHGSESSAASAEHARWVEARLSGFHAVRSAFLEQAPHLADVLGAQPGPCVVAGLFAAHGSHAAEDVPLAIQSASADGKSREIAYTGPVGTSERMTPLIAAQVSAFGLGGGRVAGPR